MDQLYDPTHSHQLKAASVAVGIFTGILPIWGFQLILAVFLALIFKLNKALVLIFSNISIPPMIPLVIFLSYKAGSFWMGNKVTEITFNTNISLNTIHQHLEQYIYGSITLAVIASIATGLLTFILLKIFKKPPTLQYKLTGTWKKA